MLTIIQTYFAGKEIQSFETLPLAGSDRKYERVVVDNISYIACENKNIAENESFFYLSDFFRMKHILVPEIFIINEDKTQYIQEDVGRSSLLDCVLDEGYNQKVFTLYQDSLKSLVKMQIEGGASIVFSKCFSNSTFDKRAILADLNYFKYYFLDLHKIQYNKTKLFEEFEQLATLIGDIQSDYFMYRDFQGRNIMIRNEKAHFIDYQGGMKGPLQYDVASLLWQAKAKLPSAWKEDLYTYYKTILQTYIPIDETIFDAHYGHIVLVRLLQVLGAYGLRGLIEKRAHFLSSIPLGLQHISEWQARYSMAQYPELKLCLDALVSLSNSGTKIENSGQTPIEMHGSTSSKLQIIVQSFSYKKGLPEDESGNGGGYMFDCRGILNPGRFEEYKKLTGRDQAVIDFLENKTKVNEFLEHAKKIVSISIDDYIQRGFEHLIISFGCTGGQHRSVYCTDKMAAFIQEKYKLPVTIKHIVQDAKNWVNL